MTKLHVEVVGIGSPLVLLHGWGWHSGIWQPLLPLLQERYQLYLVDLPGFGNSPLLTERYDFESIASLIGERVPARAVWLGWSMGGLFAFWMAIHHPLRVSHLITVAASPKFVCDVDWPGVNDVVLEKFSKWLMADQYKTLSDFLELQLRGAPHNALLCELREKLFDQRSTSYTAALVGGLQLLSKTDLRLDLERITCPTLHIFGQLDTIVPWQVVNAFSAYLPTGQYEIIKRAGHMPFLSYPETFKKLLCEFLG